MILCIGTTPAAQRVMVFAKLEVDAVNRAAKTLDGAAGKSVNVAKVLAALGAKPLAMGFAGGQRGQDLVQHLKQRDIESYFVTVTEPLRQCITVLDEFSKTVTELVEESRPVSPAAYDQLLELVINRLDECEAVVMSGSLTPGGRTDFYRAITEQSTGLGILTVVDAQGIPLEEALKAKPGLVKPNRTELAATVNRSLSNEAEVIAAMREIQNRGAGRVVVTSGKEDSLALEEQSIWRIRSPKIRAVNPIGSGDAFTAGLVWRLTEQDTLGEACRWAAAAGAANALNVMPGELSKTDVERLANEIEVEQL